MNIYGFSIDAKLTATRLAAFPEAPITTPAANCSTISLSPLHFASAMAFNTSRQYKIID